MTETQPKLEEIKAKYRREFGILAETKNTWWEKAFVEVWDNAVRDERERFIEIIDAFLKEPKIGNLNQNLNALKKIIKGLGSEKP